MRRESNKVDEAIEHILWCGQWQGDGFIPLRVMRERSGKLAVVETGWLHNRDRSLERKLREFLGAWSDRPVTVLYSPVAFSKKRALAKYAVESQLAYVDADNPLLSPEVPQPTRIVASSARNGHWFWILSAAVGPDDLQAINRALTRLVHGDKGGHSPAKLFRIPGFPNLKHDPPALVSVTKDTGELHDADRLLSLAGPTVTRAKDNQVVPDDVVDRAAEIDADSIVRHYRRSLHPDTRARLRQRKVYGPFLQYPGDDRSEIIWGIALDLRRAGASPEAVLAVVTSTVFWKARERDGKAEDPARLIRRVFEADLDDEASPKTELSADNFLHAVDPAIWDGLPVPERSWRVSEMIPDNKVTMVTGDGGTGKTLLMVMLAVACATGQPFLDIPVEPCRVYALLGENDETDTRIALADVCRHYSVTLADLGGQVRIASRSGFDNVLMAFDKGTGEATALFEELFRQVAKFRPGLVIIETAADAFAGNENARLDVKQFVVSCCERIAREVGCAVVICAHPSVAGMIAGHGYSGSTAWNASVRSRLYLRRELDKHGHEENPDVRVLELKKANFARQGTGIDLIWRDGVFEVNDPVKQRAGTSDADARVVAEVGRAFDDGDPWSAHPQARFRYLGTWLRTNLGQSDRAATATIGRLLAGGRIVQVDIDAHTHKKGLATAEQAARVGRKAGVKKD